MTISLTEKNYNYAKQEINACLTGEMCKIMKIENRKTGEVWYEICTDVTCGGWTCSTGRAFHPVSMDGDCVYTGLGTFYLVRSGKIYSTGEHILEFTDDLNPDMP